MDVLVALLCGMRAFGYMRVRDGCRAFSDARGAFWSADYDPTIESSYRRQVVIDDTACVLDILDTAGQEEYSALRSQWIRSGEGFIILYSIADHLSLMEARSFRRQILQVKDIEEQDAPPMGTCESSAALLFSCEESHARTNGANGVKKLLDGRLIWSSSISFGKCAPCERRYASRKNAI